MEQFVSFCAHTGLFAHLSGISIDVDKLAKGALLSELYTLDESLRMRNNREIRPFSTRLYFNQACEGEICTWDLEDASMFKLTDRDKDQKSTRRVLAFLGDISINNSPVDRKSDPKKWTFKRQNADFCTVDHVDIYFGSSGGGDMKHDHPVRPAGMMPIGTYAIENFTDGSELLKQICQDQNTSGQESINITSKCPLPVCMFTTWFVEDMKKCTYKGTIPFLNFTNLISDAQQDAKEFKNMLAYYGERKIEKLTVVVGRGRLLTDTHIAKDFRIQLGLYSKVDDLIASCEVTKLSNISTITINVDFFDGLKNLYAELKRLDEFAQKHPHKFKTVIYMPSKYKAGEKITWLMLDGEFKLAECRFCDNTRSPPLKNIRPIYINNAVVSETVIGGVNAWQFTYQTVPACKIGCGDKYYGKYLMI
jgi:hypothetical protein